MTIKGPSPLFAPMMQYFSGTPLIVDDNMESGWLPYENKIIMSRKAFNEMNDNEIAGIFYNCLYWYQKILIKKPNKSWVTQEQL